MPGRPNRLFLAFPPEVQRVIYITNLIESMNSRLRKVTRNRGQFPSEQAALKVLYLAVRNLEEYRSPNTGIRSSGGNRRSRRSPSTSAGESPPMKPPRSLTQTVEHSPVHPWLAAASPPRALPRRLDDI
jgi:hypothetical protein